MKHDFHFTTFILVVPVLNLQGEISITQIENSVDIPDEATVIDVYNDAITNLDEEQIDKIIDITNSSLIKSKFHTDDKSAEDIVTILNFTVMTFEYVKTKNWFNSSKNFVLAVKQSHEFDYKLYNTNGRIEISDGISMEAEVARQWCNHRDNHRLYIENILI